MSVGAPGVTSGRSCNYPAEMPSDLEYDQDMNKWSNMGNMPYVGGYYTNSRH